MSALSDAVARSFAAREGTERAVSPLRALGRRSLSGYEIMAQSVATTAPAASMVILPVTMLAHSMLLGGMLTIVAATVVIWLIALCVSQFTRRMAAAGGLYSFVVQGLGARAALTAGVTMAAKYLFSASMTLYHGGQAVIAVLAHLGIVLGGTGPRVAVYLTIAAVLLATLVRGVKFAAVAILVIEVCSLLFLVVLMLATGTGQEPVVAPSAATTALLAMVLSTIFALAGFESATFFGPETKRPLVAVTRTVLWTPILCGSLFVFAAWATWSGRSGTVVNAYLHGTATGVSPLVVVALNLALTFSWLGSAMASSGAASRLFYTMGVERVLPAVFARVHGTYRTPVVALGAIVAAVGLVAIGTTVLGPTTIHPHLQPMSRVAVILGYVLVAFASLRFLHRIGEHTPFVRAAGVAGTSVGTAVLAAALWSYVAAGDLAVPVAAAALLVSGLLWYAYLRRRCPAALAAVGVFDTPETDDVLPGSGVFSPDAAGNLALTAGPPVDGPERPDRDSAGTRP